MLNSGGKKLYVKVRCCLLFGFLMGIIVVNL